MNFNQKAATWDSIERIHRADIIAAEIIKTIPLKNNYLALEFGCGTGLISFSLMDRFMHITLIDTSEGMIEMLRHKIKAHHATNMDAVLGNMIDNIQLVPAKVDVIYSSMVMHHILDLKTTLEIQYNLLNDQGYLCIVDLVKDDGSYHKHDKEFNGHNGFDPPELAQLLTDSGFHDVNYHIFYQDSTKFDQELIPYSLFILVGRK